MALYIELAVFWNAEIYHGGVQATTSTSHNLLEDEEYRSGGNC